LYIGSILIIPLFWWMGYLANVLKNSIEKKNQLPAFKFSRQMKYGLFVFLIIIVYFGIPFIIKLFNRTLGILLLWVVAFFFPIILCNYVTGRGIFNFSKVRDVLKKNFKGFVIVFLVSILVEIIVSLPMNLSLFGVSEMISSIVALFAILLSIIVIPYVGFVFARLYGEEYRKVQ